MMYSDALLECFLNTIHAGELTGENVHVFLHQSIAPFSSFQLYMQVTDEQIVRAAFHASATPVLIAVCEYLCRWIEGKPYSALHQLQRNTVQQDLGLSATMMHDVDLVLSHL